GRTFDVWLLEKPRTADEILAMIRQAGAGVAAAHRAGLVHRDFKPTNVLVGNDDVVKVTDFGLARSFSAAAIHAAGATRQLRVPQGPVTGDGPTVAAPHPPQLAGDPFAARQRASGVHAVLTQVDSVVGTPAYMAPEQAAGRAIDARTDQYALAVTLLDALLGQSASRRRVPPAPPAPRRSRRAVLLAVGFALCGVAAGAWFVVQRAEPPSCSPEAPRRWAGAPRARVVAALSAVP